MAQVTINHVFSNDVHSQIFLDLMGYFESHRTKFQYLPSSRPVAGALIRHYHRPNLENSLVNPAIVTVHHDLAESDDWLAFRNYEDRYRAADLVICLNSEQQRFLADVGIHNTTRIPHGYNPAYLKPIAREFDGQRKIRLGVFSRRYPRKVKGEAYLQELLKRLDPDKFSFLFIGQDRTTDARFARALDFEARAYEALPYPVLCSAYQGIDALLIASQFEGGPANVPEAIATATPILSSRVGMCVDFVTSGRNGEFLTLAPAPDADLLESLHADPQRIADLFKGAIEQSTAAITWSENIRQHEQQYGALLQTIFGVTP